MRAWKIRTLPSQREIPSPARKRRRRPSPRIPVPIPSRSVSPAELRAIGSAPTSTHAVWLPSTMRCSRSHVVNGSRRIASAGASATSNDDQTEIAGLQHERERADRLLERALIHIAAHARIRHDVPADPEQAIEIDAGRRRRFDVEHVERIDERDELAARGRGRQHLQQQARAARRSRADQLGQLAAREPAAEPCVEGGKPGRARRRIRRAGSSGGSAVVSVRSSWRARSSDSRSARARGIVVFALSSPYRRTIAHACVADQADDT